MGSELDVILEEPRPHGSPMHRGWVYPRGVLEFWLGFLEAMSVLSILGLEGSRELTALS
eukprot:CAMPEP_0184299574 /NCGR_PEP_ID=MMETSP1049-20130417/10159_1 /TAXON_ID=77928 /ORGANISM="Proteomonas sulcata, Strain CCMP704" /LENGTH=58 /DNA_ID=CAMNT_0026610051 /DNA_START=755 /DNA_END=931 /DNA_ORIENTATION=-